MARTSKGASILLLGILLTACNGGDSSFAGGGSGGATAPGSGGTTTVQFGSGSGGNFQAGTLAIATSKLSAGGTTTVTATLVKDDGTPYTGATDVSFISDCVQQGLATLESPVKADNGAAVSTYTDKGCGTTDTITASATINGTRLTAQGTVLVAPAELGAIAFISAEPTTISFKGSGLTEASRVTFEVRDSIGNPLRNQTVNFSLSTEVGGISLSQSTAVSGADGRVATVVQAGTIPTPVRVKATVENTNVSTQSNVLTISTGIADADSFSISIEKFNPEAWDYDGVTDKVTVHLADRFNNPVPDGTAVSFHTEGGSIEPQCQTKDGTCSVIWTSQNPRPADGRVTILAYAIGEESFVDTNGNGWFDPQDTNGDGQIDDTDKTDTFTDIGEPFANEDESYADDANQSCPPSTDPSCKPSYQLGEFFFDFSQDGKRNGPDGHFEGLQCVTNCGPDGKYAPVDTDTTDNVRPLLNFTTGISDQLVLVMSGNTAIICTTPTTSAQPACGSPMTVNAGGTLKLYVADLRGQTMPAGTTIKVAAQNVTLSGQTSITVPSTTTPPAYTPYVFDVGSIQATPATITVTVTTPDNQVSTEDITVQ